MGIKTNIRQQLPEFISLCKKHKVNTIYAFGSSINKRFDPETSDVDLVVDINEDHPLERGELLLSLWDKLEVFFNRKVDLLTESSIKNPFLKESIEATKVLIYDGSRQKVFI